MGILNRLLTHKPSYQLYVPFADFAWVGGPRTFAMNFKRYLDSIGYRYVSDPNNADLIFLPVWTSIEMVKQQKMSRDVKLVMRMDGVYYPQQHGEEYKDHNKPIKELYDLADFIVFQTDYARKQVFEMLGSKPAKDYTQIVNGIYGDKFFPRQTERDASSPLRFVTSGNFRKEGMLKFIVEALDSLVDRYDFELAVAGPIQGNCVAKYADRPYIEHLGEVSNEEISGILRQSDVFLHSQLNDICPNSVLEAVATALPVVGFQTGSMTELLPFSTDLLAYVSDDLLQTYDDFSAEALAEKLELVLNDYPRYRARSAQHIADYDFERCGQAYVAVLDQVAHIGS